MSQQPVRWSKGGMIEYIDGKAWGTAPKGAPILLGSEETVNKSLSEGLSLGHPVKDDILQLELEARGDCGSDASI